MVAGYTNNRSEGNYDFYLLKIAADGNLVWNKTYGRAESEKAYSMAKAPDGYVLVGDVDSPQTATDAWAVMVDLNGNMVWNTTVGGKNADSPAYITPAKDGGYLVAGFTFSFGAGQRDFWLFKIDEAGQVIWSCTQGNAGFPGSLQRHRKQAIISMLWLGGRIRRGSLNSSARRSTISTW